MNPQPGISRRTLLTNAGALISLSALAAACGDGKTTSAGGGDVTLTFATFGGVYGESQRKAWLDPFMKANPDIKVVEDQPVDYAKIKAMVESGNVTWDVVDVGGDFGLDSSKALLEAIDCQVVATCQSPAVGLKNSAWRVAENVTTLAVGYDQDTLKGKSPTSFKDFFDLAGFPGKRGLWKLVSGGALEFALLADGVDAASLYPLDVDRALAKLNTIKKSVVWFEGPTAGQGLLASGEASMVVNYAARPYDLKTRMSRNVGIVWDRHLVQGSYLVIPKGAKNKDAAMKLIAWITDPKNNAEITKYYSLAPGSASAVGSVDASVKDWLATSHVDGAVGQDDTYWDANFGPVNEKFQAWLTK